MKVCFKTMTGFKEETDVKFIDFQNDRIVLTYNDEQEIPFIKKDNELFFVSQRWK